MENRKYTLIQGEVVIFKEYYDIIEKLISNNCDWNSIRNLLEKYDIEVPLLNSINPDILKGLLIFEEINKIKDIDVTQNGLNKVTKRNEKAPIWKFNLCFTDDKKTITRFITTVLSKIIANINYLYVSIDNLSEIIEYKLYRDYLIPIDKNPKIIYKLINFNEVTYFTINTVRNNHYYINLFILNLEKIFRYSLNNKIILTNTELLNISVKNSFYVVFDIINPNTMTSNDIVEVINLNCPSSGILTFNNKNDLTESFDYFDLDNDFKNKNGKINFISSIFPLVLGLIFLLIIVKTSTDVRTAYGLMVIWFIICLVVEISILLKKIIKKYKNKKRFNDYKSFHKNNLKEEGN